MNPSSITEGQKKALQDLLEGKVLFEEPLAPYTSARIGGPADCVVHVRSREALVQAANALWELGVPFRVLGGGSNVLVSDAGMRGAVILNMARQVEFIEDGDKPQLQAESGASLASVSKRTIERGWSGLEWGSGVPGTIGGAIVGNAGAHGSDISEVLLMAEILQHANGIEEWSVDDFEYAYRDSRLKRNPGRSVVISGRFALQQSTVDRTKATANEILNYRQRTQPPGASWGSMFKNPGDDYAGRLIESAGLKGYRQGKVQISPTHANFFINLGGAKAVEVWELVQHTRQRVFEDTGIQLELEIELFGDWGSSQTAAPQGKAEGKAS